MTMRSDAEDASRRAYLGVTRASLVKPDDKPKMQELTVRARFGEQWTNVEHWQPHGRTVVPLEPDKQGEAEVLIAYLGGSPDHPIAISVADRRHRPKDLKAGDVADFDHRGQKVVLHKDGTTRSSPLTITHNVVDKEGKVLSTIVQHKDGKKITMTNKDGATVEMDGANITHKPGSGGKFHVDGHVTVAGSVTAAEDVTGASVFSGGSPVATV